MSSSPKNTPPPPTADPIATPATANAAGEGGGGAAAGAGDVGASANSDATQVAAAAAAAAGEEEEPSTSAAAHRGQRNSEARSRDSASSGGAAGGNGERLSPEQDIFINPADGLPSQHPTLPDGEVDSDAEEAAVDPDSFDDLPTSIIVTNIHSEVFTTPELKQQMEALFRSFSESATFQWLRSFRRLRVNYDNAVAAANARIKLHQYEFNKKTVITCYFAQPVTPVSNKNLQPPAPVKQFLISPPASPPAGWEPREENEPLVNHDLLAALASLTPGESHELHPQTDDQPAIIVHTAMLPEGGVGAGGAAAGANNNGPPVVAAPTRQPIVQTKCPERT